MVEYQSIQQRGFHNTYDSEGRITGFEFKFVPKYYKGLWFTQCRLGSSSASKNTGSSAPR